MQEAGATDQVTKLANRAAAHADLDDPFAVASLPNALLAAGATDQVATLLKRDPADRVALDKPFAVAELLYALRRRVPAARSPRWPTVPPMLTSTNYG